MISKGYRASFLTLPILAALAGCGAIKPESQIVAQNARAGFECGGPSQPSCSFFEGPLQLASNAPVRLPNRSYPFFPTVTRLGFVDSSEGRWLAPPRTLTDGASIPKIFVPVIGAPRSPQFANAAALHDAYCGIGNEKGPNFHTADWAATHRMFYDALRVGGTGEIRAKIMFAAVYLGGPRWGAEQGNDLSSKTLLFKLRSRNVERFADQTGQTATVPPALEDALSDNLPPYLRSHRALGEGNTRRFAQSPWGATRYDRFERDLSGVAPTQMRQILRDAERYIRTTKPTPSINEIILWLERSETRLVSRLLEVRDKDRAPGKIRERAGSTDAPDEVEPIYDEYIYSGGVTPPGAGSTPVDCDPASGAGCY